MGRSVRLPEFRKRERTVENSEGIFGVGTAPAMAYMRCCQQYFFLPMLNVKR